MLRFNFSLIEFLSKINSIVYKNHNIFTYSIPNVAIKSVVDMTVLMMVVVKYTVRLPRLPPLGLERDSRVLHDTVIVGVQRQPVKRYYNKRIFTNTSCYHKVDRWVLKLLFILVDKWVIESRVVARINIRVSYWRIDAFIFWHGSHD